MGERFRVPRGVTVHDQHGRPIARVGRTRERGARASGPSGDHGSVPDPLTGLIDRAAFEHHLTRELARIGRGGPTGAVAVLDLDEFKRVNQCHGHAAGDVRGEGAGRAS